MNSNQAQENTETDLNLNTDIVHNRGTTYTSLSELYGVQLFTDLRLEEQQGYETKLNLKEKNVHNNIFVNKLVTKDADQETKGTLFQEPLVIAKKQDYMESSAISQGVYWGGAGFISMVFIIVLVRYLKKGKRKTL